MKRNKGQSVFDYMLFGLLVIAVGMMLMAALSGCGGLPFSHIDVSGAGADGKNGKDGAKGSDGASGQDGLNSLVSVEHFTSDTSVCTAGSGLVVSSGLDQDKDNQLEASEIQTTSVVCDGEVGPEGPQGIQGQAGTVVASVQFCPDTPSYPSTFPETGLCINNQLYAVYSTHGGFLTLLTEGVYSSNAVGSKCDFTVLPNCQIQN